MLLEFSYMGDSYIIEETTFTYTHNGTAFEVLLDRLEVGEELLHVFDKSTPTPWVFVIEDMENIKWS